MDSIADKLLPAFVAALALQHLAELISSFFDWWKGNAASGKKLLIGTVAAVLAGWALTVSNIGILNGVVPRRIDVFLSSLAVSAGVDGLNSILKFALYKKDEAKPATTATDAVSPLDPAASLSLPQPEFP